MISLLNKLIFATWGNKAVVNFIDSCFFNQNVLIIIFWPLSPIIIFILFKFFRSKNFRGFREYLFSKIFIFYFLLSVLVILGRLFTSPFTDIEKIAYIIFPISPLIFPLLFLFEAQRNIFSLVFKRRKEIPLRIEMIGKWFGTTVILIVYLLSLAFSILVIISFYGVGYKDFIGRGQKYYTEISSACSEVVSALKNDNDYFESELAGNDARLPMPLRNLHATKVKFKYEKKRREYELWLMIGISRPGFGIYYYQNDIEKNLRSIKLSAISESYERVLYSVP